MISSAVGDLGKGRAELQAKRVMVVPLLRCADKSGTLFV
jgi:hypothetical protein